jgi:hypothetical protein
MDANIGRAGFQIGSFMVFISGALLLFLERGTAEHSITLLTFLLGLIFMVGIAIAVRWSQRKP